MRTCDIQGCAQKHYGRGYCYKHYYEHIELPRREARRAQRPVPRERICSVESCTRKHAGLGFCRLHYTRIVAAPRQKQRRAQARRAAGYVPRSERVCCIAGCDRAVFAREYCHSHYKTHHYRGACIEPGCSAGRHAQNRCASHYEQARRTGDVGIVQPQRQQSVNERFDGYVDASGPAGACRGWTGPVVQNRAYFTVDSTTVLAAPVFAYEREHGPIPTDPDTGRKLHIDHRCRTPWCTWLPHLEAVTPMENSRRGRVAAGHEPITSADAWFWIALDQWANYAADNFPDRVVRYPDREAAA